MTGRRLSDLDSFTENAELLKPNYQGYAGSLTVAKQLKQKPDCRISDRMATLL